MAKDVLEPNHPNEATQQGEGLIEELRSGWRPLPLRAVVSLVLAGLKVRLSRSLVTMVTVVLAITFLTYTGLTEKVNYNLALLATELTEAPMVPPAEARAAAAAVSGSELVNGLEGPVSDWLELWISEPSDEIEERLAQVRALPIVPEREEARLARNLQLKLWLEGRSPELSEAEIEESAHAAFVAEADRILTGFRNPSVWNDQQIKKAKALAAMADAADHASAGVLQRVIAVEESKRQGTQLATSLRRAGINIEATLGDNFMNTWIIIMALLLCAVGIANAMLMSVTERFREIGTMKCLGAQDGLVVKLFLLESAFLGVAGAVGGIVVGLLVALLGAFLQFGLPGISAFPFFQGIDVMFYALGAGVFLALAGTLYPALLASRMRPVDALRIDE